MPNPSIQFHFDIRWHYDEQSKKVRTGEDTGCGNRPLLGDGLKGNVGDHQISSSYQNWWTSNIIIVSELDNVLPRSRSSFTHQWNEFMSFKTNTFIRCLTFYLWYCFIQTNMIILFVGWCGWWDGRRHRFYWAKAWPIYCLSLQVLKYIHWLPESSWLLQRLTIMLP